MQQSYEQWPKANRAEISALPLINPDVDRYSAEPLVENSFGEQWRRYIDRHLPPDLVPEEDLSRKQSSNDMHQPFAFSVFSMVHQVIKSHWQQDRRYIQLLPEKAVDKAIDDYFGAFSAVYRNVKPPEAKLLVTNRSIYHVNQFNAAGDSARLFPEITVTNGLIEAYRRADQPIAAQVLCGLLAAENSVVASMSIAQAGRTAAKCVLLDFATHRPIALP